ncbi:hypothetical protein PPTG_20849 [Phytophthora nicotianae INRA-310]|uniref:Uncharacterized protein n=1 Tax=Phytophthora nicotianae (strain INRA-310) TaxID=761204 RepID=W2RHT2_PHYN3|nr:hypothetical protein PPTG_20849 [Phytophthora nicotianae INRA-310]ETN24947.1 hypothetical protein PPTG_20849 [Phytophthora nicotianae INRA-310]
MRVDQSLTIPINNVRAQQGQKMKRNTNPEDECRYYFEIGQFKADCATRAIDQDKQREGSPLYRTDIKTAPGATRDRKRKGATQLEESMDKEDDVESEYLACHDDDDAPMIEQGSESPMDLDMIEREVRQKNDVYLRKLETTQAN